jgi:hypothetical protein
MDQMSDPFTSPESLSHAVVQAGEELGIQQAEVASIINFMCEGTHALFEDRVVLEPNTETWRRAELFVRLHQALRDKMHGDRAKMVHWLGTENPALGGEPLVVMEDEGRLEDVLALLDGGG